jgi:hypothetical protein
MSKNGLILLKPTTVDKTGTSATISANGSVEFTSCSSLSLNGVFSDNYDNYMIVTRANVTTPANVFIRFRDNGSDDSTSNSYVYQYIIASSSAVAGSRTTLNLGGFFIAYANQRVGSVGFIYGPYLSQPTAYRTINVDDNGDASIQEYGGTHNQSASYDGFTLSNGGNLSGRIAVYGMRK